MSFFSLLELFLHSSFTHAQTIEISGLSISSLSSPRLSYHQLSHTYVISLCISQIILKFSFCNFLLFSFFIPSCSPGLYKIRHFSHNFVASFLSASVIQVISTVTLTISLNSPHPDLKNGGRGTKPAYKFMVINPLVAIELKATPNGNPTNDFYWRQKSSSRNVVQCNTTSESITFYRPNLYSLTEKFRATKLHWSTAQDLFLSCYFNIDLNQFLLS